MRYFSKVVIAVVLLTGFSLSIFGCEKQPSAPAAPSKSQSSSGQQSPPPQAVQPSAPVKPAVPAGFKTARTCRYFYILLDTSGSMSGSIDEAKRAIASFLNNAPPDAIFAFATFVSNGAQERVAFGEKSKQEILNILPKIGTNGGTPLGEAIYYSNKKLREQAERQYGDGIFNLVVVTDGAADRGSPMDQAVAEMSTTVVYGQPLNLYTIGWRLPKGHALADKSVLYLEANNAAELVNALERATKAEAVDLKSLLGL